MGLIYMGSKRRLGRYLRPILMRHRAPGMPYIEPFCGGGNMLELMAGTRWGNDCNAHVVAYFRAVQRGWQPPRFVSHAMYDDIRGRYRQGDRLEPALVAYVGFNFSYGGKFMEGYAVSDSPTAQKYGYEHYRNSLALSKYAHTKRAIQGVRFSCSSYHEMVLPHTTCLVYCDPPYKASTGYADSFDHADYWEWVRTQARRGHIIYCSEYQAPDDFVCIWEKAGKTTLANATQSGEDNPLGKKYQRVERLFMYAPCAKHTPVARQPQLWAEAVAA